MATTTSNFGLRKPDPVDTVDVTTDINGSMDTIDGLLAGRGFGGVDGLLQGAWYGVQGERGSSFAPGNGARAVPLVLVAATTIDQFAVMVDTVATDADTCLIAVYDDTGRCYPNAKIHGDFSIAVNGTAGVAATVSITPITLGPGIVWLAAVPNTTTEWTTTQLQGAQVLNLAGDDATDALDTPVLGYRDLDALANTLPATWTTTVNGGSNMTLIGFHTQAAV